MCQKYAKLARLLRFLLFKVVFARIDIKNVYVFLKYKGKMHLNIKYDRLKLIFYLFIFVCYQLSSK